MNFNGLSIDQAPPISAPLRFFLTAPLFAVLAGCLLLFSDATVLSTRFSLESIAITHTITIGFFGFIMLGAITQMLPVLAGVKIWHVENSTKYAHLALFLGLLSLIYGFYTTQVEFYKFAFFGLGSGFLCLIFLIGLALRDVKNFTPTVRNMAISLSFAFVSVLLGLFLLSEYARDSLSAWHLEIANIHSVWAIFGFAGILVVGVSFQVLPMFYVAPAFKNFFLSKLTKLISLGLLLWLVLSLFVDSYAFIAKIWIALFFLAFSITVWIKLNQRKRKTSDITIWYWRMSSVFLTLSLVLWVFDVYLHEDYTVLIALLFGLGFLMSLMMGMLYKIVPFLVWFHLNGAGYMSIPTMNEMIDKKLTKLQFFLFYISLFGFIIAYFIPLLVSIFALTFILSMLILEYNVVTCALLYAKIKKTKPDFDMSAFQ